MIATWRVDGVPFPSDCENMVALAKQPKPAPEEQYNVAQLAEVVAGLTVQVRQLALILDEVREELIWAVRNDKFNAAGASQRFVAEHLAPSAGKKPKEQMPVAPPPVLPTIPEPPAPRPRRRSGESSPDLFS